MDREYLYIVVTDYPYGIGEPYLENELQIISPLFNKVFILIPQIQSVDTRHIRYQLPSNCHVIPMEIKVQRKHQIYAATRLFSKAVWIEILHIIKQYKQRISITHLKQIVGFLASGKALSDGIRLLIAEHGFDLQSLTIYSYWCSSSAAGLSFIKEQDPEINTVIRMHGWDCFFYRSPMNYLPMRPWILMKNDHVCVVSKMGQKHLIELLSPELSSKVKVSYLGTFSEDTSEKPQFKQGTLRILSVAFLQPVKRIDWLIQALSHIENVPIEWTHMGSWTAHEQAIRDLADTLLGPKSNIKFNFTGEVSNIEVQRFMQDRKADFLVCSSSSEGLPVSMMEAMSYGMPVLSTNAGGISELVEHHRNGILTDVSNDLKPFVGMLLEASSFSVDTYLEYSKSARAKFELYFSAKNNYLKFAEEYLKTRLQ